MGKGTDLSGFSFASVMALKQEALAMQSACREASSTAYRAFAMEEEVDPRDRLTEEELEEYQADYMAISKSNETMIPFYAWVIELCDKRVESEMAKLKEAYEEQKDSGE